MPRWRTCDNCCGVVEENGRSLCYACDPERNGKKPPLAYSDVISPKCALLAVVASILLWVGFIYGMWNLFS